MLGQSTPRTADSASIAPPRWRITVPAARHLVGSGILMLVLYIFMDVFATLRYDGYSYTDQTISELSAIAAPTRDGWLVMSVFYGILTFAFAFGVLGMDAGRRVRVIGWLLLAGALVGQLWWLAPMHQREVLAADAGDWRDTMHLVVGGVNSILFFAMIGIGAFTFGRRLRWYSLTTIVAMVVFGALMSAQTGDVANDGDTAWLGIYERIAVEGAILWQAVFATVLLWVTRAQPGNPGPA